MKILFFLCTIPMYCFYDGSISIGGFGFMYSYLFGLLFIFLTFWHFLLHPDTDRAIFVGKASAVLMFPYLFSIAWSMSLWVFNLSQIRMITRGLFFPVYQLIAIGVGASAVYCFGGKGIFYQFASMTVSYLILAAYQAAQGGIGEFLYEYVVLLQSGATLTGPLMKEMEKASLGHGFGLFLLYFLVTEGARKRKLLLFLRTLPLFFMGYKRSALFGLLAAVAVSVFVGRIKEQKSQAVLAFSVALSAAGLLYIWSIFSGTLDALAEVVRIDSMGRLEIYDTMKEYCSFSLGYLGKGLGFVSYMIGRGLIDVGYEFAGDIHNDMFRQFIELGMIGFCLWSLSYFVFRVKVLSKIDVWCGRFTLVCSIYCFVCYLTENMYYRFSTNTVLAVGLLSYALARYESRRKEMGDE